MELEVEAAAGAAKGERSPLRTAQRNGYRERPWETRAGRIEPRRTAEKALVAVIQEAYVHGVSTRAVDDRRRAPWAAGASQRAR